jgi:hypothetical protein
MSADGDLRCVLCRSGFESAWDLMVHVQDCHNVNVYTLARSNNNNLREDREKVRGRDTLIRSRVGSAAG